MRLLLYLCEGTERTLGSCIGMRWWNQADIYLEGVRETVTAAAEGEEDGVEE